MAIYDADGTQLFSAYDADGTELQYAYDADGTVIFTAQPLNLKVMTYNCGGWYNGTGQSVPSAYDAQYYDLQNGIMERNNPDVLCIQEYRDLFSVNGRTALSVLEQYFPYHVTRQGDTNYWGHAIYSKYPIESYTEYHYANDQSRYYGSAVININGHRVTVICTHLSTDAAKRPAQSAELLTYANTLSNAIVCGDFNLHCRSKDYYYSYNGRYEWIESYKPWDDAGYNFGNNNDYFGFIGTMYNSNPSSEATAGWWSLDNIMTSPAITITDVYVDNAKKTNPVSVDPDWMIDHIPFVAEISLS